MYQPQSRCIYTRPQGASPCPVSSPCSRTKGSCPCSRRSEGAGSRSTRRTTTRPVRRGHRAAGRGAPAAAGRRGADPDPLELDRRRRRGVGLADRPDGGRAPPPSPPLVRARDLARPRGLDRPRRRLPVRLAVVRGPDRVRARGLQGRPGPPGPVRPPRRPGPAPGLDLRRRHHRPDLLLPGRDAARRDPPDRAPLHPLPGRGGAPDRGPRPPAAGPRRGPGPGGPAPARPARPDRGGPGPAHGRDRVPPGRGDRDGRGRRAPGREPGRGPVPRAGPGRPAPGRGLPRALPGARTAAPGPRRPAPVPPPHGRAPRPDRATGSSARSARSRTSPTPGPRPRRGGGSWPRPSSRSGGSRARTRTSRSGSRPSRPCSTRPSGPRPRRPRPARRRGGPRRRPSPSTRRPSRRSWRPCPTRSGSWTPSSGAGTSTRPARRPRGGGRAGWSAGPGPRSASPGASSARSRRKASSVLAEGVERAGIWSDGVEGAPQVYHYALRRVADPAGAPGVLVTIRDGTLLRRHFEERSRTGPRQEQLHAVLRAILDQMPIGVVIAEAPSGRVIFRNPGFVEIWGEAAPSPARIEEYDVWTGIRPGGGTVRPARLAPRAGGRDRRAGPRRGDRGGPRRREPARLQRQRRPDPRRRGDGVRRGRDLHRHHGPADGRGRGPRPARSGSASRPGPSPRSSRSTTGRAGTCS